MFQKLVSAFLLSLLCVTGSAASEPWVVLDVHPTSGVLVAPAGTQVRDVASILGAVAKFDHLRFRLEGRDRGALGDHVGQWARQLGLSDALRQDRFSVGVSRSLDRNQVAVNVVSTLDKPRFSCPWYVRTFTRSRLELRVPMVAHSTISLNDVVRFEFTPLRADVPHSVQIKKETGLAYSALIGNELVPGALQLVVSPPERQKIPFSSRQSIGDQDIDGDLRQKVRCLISVE